MLVAHVEWISAVCSILTLLCAIQLIISGLLLWNIPEVFTLTKSHIATLSGLIAAFITLPAVIRFKTARIFSKRDRLYGFTLCYQRLTISVAATLHLTALILAINALVKSVKLGEEFKKLMKFYDVRISSKVLVDNIQFLFQCCGGDGYKDWFQNINTKNTEEADNPLREDEDDIVPFSCCSKYVNVPCNFLNLEFGLEAIYKVGCGPKLEVFVYTLLWFEIVFYILSFILEVTILGLLNEGSKNIGTTTTTRSNKWGNFTNDDPSSSATSLWHSSHSEKKFINK